MSNPFDMQSDSFAINAFTPGIFKKAQRKFPPRTNLNLSDDLVLSTKEWSIEHISALKPAHFEDSENRQEMIDPKFEEEAHAAINTFWQKNHLVVPSPDVPSTSRKYQLSNSAMYYDFSNPMDDLLEEGRNSTDEMVFAELDGLQKRSSLKDDLVLSTKEWSIEHISALKPAHFEDSENRQEMIDPKFEEEAHAAINTFWQKNHLVVPSPDVPSTSRKYQLSNSAMYYDFSNPMDDLLEEGRNSTDEMVFAELDGLQKRSSLNEKFPFDANLSPIKPTQE